MPWLGALLLFYLRLGPAAYHGGDAIIKIFLASPGCCLLLLLLLTFSFTQSAWRPDCQGS